MLTPCKNMQVHSIQPQKYKCCDYLASMTHSLFIVNLVQTMYRQEEQVYHIDASMLRLNSGLENTQ